MPSLSGIYRALKRAGAIDPNARRRRDFQILIHSKCCQFGRPRYKLTGGNRMVKIHVIRITNKGSGHTYFSARYRAY